jgi:hypothetical protein
LMIDDDKARALDRNIKKQRVHEAKVNVSWRRDDGRDQHTYWSFEEPHHLGIPIYDRLHANCISSSWIACELGTLIGVECVFLSVNGDRLVWAYVLSK